MRKLWVYTYLKHDCTNYDEICDTVRAQRFSRFAYPVFLHRINREILDRFPQCLDHVKGIRRSPTMRCSTCRRTREGQFNGHYWTKPEGWLYRMAAHYIHTYCSRQCSLPKKNVPKAVRRHKLRAGDPAYAATPRTRSLP